MAVVSTHPNGRFGCRSQISPTTFTTTSGGACVPSREVIGTLTRRPKAARSNEELPVNLERFGIITKGEQNDETDGHPCCPSHLARNCRRFQHALARRHRSGRRRLHQ